MKGTAATGAVVRGALCAAAVAVSAPALAAPAVLAHTSVEETRVCAPLPGGGALLGTAGGLVRIDAAGAITGRWTASDGLPGTRIEALVALGGDAELGAAEELWLGADGGAVKLAFSAAGELVTSGAQLGRPVRDVERFAGATYLATWNGGVRKLVDPSSSPPSSPSSSSVAVPFAGPSPGKQTAGARAQVTSLAVAGGMLYAATAAGLYRLERGRLVKTTVDGLTAAGSIAALHGDGDTLWLATAEGLFARRGDGVTRGFGGGELRAIAALHSELVVAGVSEGLQRVDRGRLVAFAGQRPPRQLTFAQALGVRGDAVCTGGLHGAWLRAGADAAWIAAAPSPGPPSNDLSALAVEGERLWVGSFDRGLALLEAGRWRSLSHPELDGRINAILVEPRPSRPARIWIATASGLSALESPEPGASLAATSPLRLRSATSPDAAASPLRVSRLERADGLPGRGVLALSHLSDGRLLVGGSYGAVIVDARDAASGGQPGGRPVKIGPKELGAVWAVAQTADGALWLGATTGVYRGFEDDRPWQRFSLATGHLSDDWVMALAARGDALYAGTYKGGVVKLAASAEAPSGFSATAVRPGWVNPGGLVLDGGRLLAATMDGLATCALAGPASCVGAGWSAQPGLPGVDVTDAARIGSTLYVATRRGLAEVRAPMPDRGTSP